MDATLIKEIHVPNPKYPSDSPIETFPYLYLLEGRVCIFTELTNHGPSAHEPEMAMQIMVSLWQQDERFWIAHKDITDITHFVFYALLTHVRYSFISEGSYKYRRFHPTSVFDRHGNKFIVFISDAKIIRIAGWMQEMYKPKDVCSIREDITHTFLSEIHEWRSILYA